jgi:hypothetical protein
MMTSRGSRGKQVLVAILIALAAAIDLAASMMAGSGVRGTVIVAMFAVAFALMACALIFIYTNRRPR